MNQMNGHTHFDQHVFTPGVGHIMSEDCWCEPVKTYWVPGANGKMLHVLEHNDGSLVDDEWVNKTLYRVGKG